MAERNMDKEAVVTAADMESPQESEILQASGDNATLAEPVGSAEPEPVGAQGVVSPPPETKEQLRAALRAIETWEKEQKDIWFFEKLGRIPFLLLDKLTPKILQQKIGQALDEVGSYVQTGGRYLISEREILRKMQASSIAGASAMPLANMNAVAADLSGSRKTLATMQGATTGFGGVFTLAVDVPALLGLSLKIIQEIAICYGYDPKLKEERIFAVKCLQFASSDIVGKKAILDELSLYGRKNAHDQMASQLQGWREVITVYRDNYGWKKLFQLIPVAGMIFGAFINRGTLQDVAEAATMLYRKRRVLERLDQLDQIG